MSRAEDLLETIASIGVGHFPIKSVLGKRNERIFTNPEAWDGRSRLDDQVRESNLDDQNSDD